MTGRIKLLHLQLWPILSGVQKVTLNLFQHLDQSRYELWLACAPELPGREDSLIQAARGLGVNVVIIPALRREGIGFSDLAAFRQILTLMKRERFDVVHTHSSKTGFMGRIAARLAGCPRIVHTVHGISFHEWEPIWKRIPYYLGEWFASFFTDRVITVNRYYLRFWSRFGCRDVRTIYNGMDYQGLPERIPDETGRIRVLFAGRFDRQKAPLVFLKAMRQVLLHYPDTRITLAGEGPLRTRMEAYIAANNMVGRVCFVGWVTDIPTLMARHDIFVSSSLWEAFGLVFCEAGAVGLPVVATLTEGVPEVVLHGETGLLVPPGGSWRLGNAVCRLIEDPELRESLGKTGQIWVKRQFSLRRFIDSHREVYEDPKFCDAETTLRESQ